jgi:hypothetical protein
VGLSGNVSFVEEFFLEKKKGNLCAQLWGLSRSAESGRGKKIR